MDGSKAAAFGVFGGDSQLRIGSLKLDSNRSREENRIGQNLPANGSAEKGDYDDYGE